MKTYSAFAIRLLLILGSSLTVAIDANAGPTSKDKSSASSGGFARGVSTIATKIYNNGWNRPIIYTVTIVGLPAWNLQRNIEALEK